MPQPTKLFAIALLCLGALSIGAEEEITQAQIEQRLKELEAEISRYKGLLESTEGQKSEIEENLEQNEKGISDLINKIDDIEEELDDGRDKVSRLHREEAELLQAKSEQQYYIEQQVRAAYEIGNQEYLKVMLNQEDPDEISRMLTYYDYFNKARAEQIETYNGTLMELDRVTLALAFENKRLAENRNVLLGQQNALKRVQQERQRTLKALIQEIASTGSELKRLGEDRKRLESLLQRIQNSLANLPTPDTAEPFSGMRGKLVMPVAGSVTHRFGKRREDGKLRWDGVFIAADEGDTVHAVHYGRVVFSDWLRGFGLLMIISHGEGYMSLYGHNQVLYRETGDWVTAGDMIAAVGDTGGQERSGLYFEIRIAGKPTDPQRWCKARQQRAA